MSRINVAASGYSFFHDHKADVLAVVEFLLLTLLYAIFMASDRVPLAGLVALGGLWVARWWTTGKWTMSTPMDIPIVGVLLMLLVSMVISMDWSLSLPKMYGVILGVAVFYAIVNAVDTLFKLRLTIVGLILLSIIVSVLGLVGADWLSNKIFSFQKLYNLLPRFVQELPRSIDGGIHPNIIGGALTFFIPFLVSLPLKRVDFITFQVVKKTRYAGILRAAFKTMLIFSLILTIFTLLLTQSRGSIIGVTMGLFTLALWSDLRFLWAIPLAMIASIVMIRIWGVESLAEFILHLDVRSGGTLPGRVEIWQRAIYMIQSFPITGVGIGTFDPISQALYPYISFGGAYIPHAHNMFLTVAVDLGVPGLVLYVALLSSFTFSAWGAYKVAAGTFRAIIVGLACGMLAHQVFGIMDAFMLGTKLGVVMWIFFGLAAVLYIRRDQLTHELMEGVAGEKSGETNAANPAAQESNSGIWQKLGLLSGLSYWALFSMLAIAFVGDQPYLSLVIALIGGGILGFICTTTSKPKGLIAQMG